MGNKFVKVFEDNAVEIVDVNQNVPFYKAAQEAIGDGCGIFEVANINVNPFKEKFKSLEVMIDEEGRLTNKGVNPLGSYLYGYNVHGQPICGNIIFGKETMTEDGPDIIGLDDNEAEALAEDIKVLIEQEVSKTVYMNKPIPNPVIIDLTSEEEMIKYLNSLMEGDD